MAQQMQRVLENSSERGDLLERAQANLTRFSWERAAREILEIVRAL